MHGALYPWAAIALSLVDFWLLGVGEDVRSLWYVSMSADDGGEEDGVERDKRGIYALHGSLGSLGLFEMTLIMRS